MTIEKQQEILAIMDYYTLRNSSGRIAIDGLKGPHLSSAIRSFQSDRNITEDGMWGPQTEQEARKAIAEGWVRPAPAFPTNPNDIEERVWEFLKSKGFSPSATAGIMGNISAESNMSPINMEDQYQNKLGFNDESYTRAVDNDSYTNFVGDAVGYGLCQWTWWTRKKGLLSSAKTAGKSVGDLQIQLDWLWHELKTQYSGMLRSLLRPDITVYDATAIFMRHFENPADQSEQAIARRASISQRYYNKFN